MDLIKERESTLKPPIIYFTFSIRMTAFLKSIGSKIWKVVITGWEPPSVTNDGKTTFKAKIEWSDSEDQASIENSRAQNAFYSEIDHNVFKLINRWKILEVKK